MLISVTAVVVSYNRAGLLRECLDGLYTQTRRPDRVILIDNASTDGAVGVARAHPLKPEITVLDHNVGGAGGFCAGIALALGSNDTTHVWLMDDDTVPTPTALERLLEAGEEARERNAVWPAALGSKAVWTDGREHLMNKPRERTWLALGGRHLVRSAGAYQVRSLSFVSCLLSARAIRAAHALPRSAFFLWNDDYEFTTRLLRRATGYYVPDSEVVHKTKVFGSSDADPGPRFFYEVRNKCWVLRHSGGNFTPAEYSELLLKTLRRWALTIMRSHDRKLTFSCLGRGLREGLGTNPQSNAVLLAGNQKVVAAIRTVEPSGTEPSAIER